MFLVTAKKSCQNIELTFLFANAISCLQSKGQEVIKAFEENYRKKLLCSLVAKMDKVTSVHDFAKLVTIADTISWIQSVSNEMKPKTIKRCFIPYVFVR